MMSETSNTQLPPNKTSGRKILLILAVIFVLPFTVAATLHLLKLKPSGHSYGNLIQPPQALQFPVLHDAQGKEFTAQQWLKIWSVVVVDSTGCAQPCQAQVHLLKQVHTSLNKDAHRLQRVLLVPTGLKDEVLVALQKQYPDLLILGGTDADAAKFVENFNVAGASMYLVDPLGNLMMSYPEKMDPKGIFSDLKRLLKNSWAG
jgi:cytochrome oxidase Cu insertion factor (SCO1/SenC/PrrC family)